MDRDGKSDPQVLLEYDGMEWKTPTVFNTLDPVWGDVFRVPVMAVPKNGEEQFLSFTVTDYDFGKRNDFMGEAVVDIRRAAVPR